MAPSLALALLLEQILIYVNQILDDGEEMVFIDETSHVRQLFFDLEVALLEELRLEVGQNGEGCLKDEDIAVEKHVVPDAARYLEVHILGKDSDEPVYEEESGVDLERLEMLLQFRQLFLEVAIEDVDAKLDILDVAAEQLDEDGFVDEVREANEGTGLIAVDQQGPRQEAQILDVVDVGSVHQEGQNQVHE